MREFETGATRDTAEGKLDYEGFLSPAVLECYAEYMHKNRIQADGKLRDSDNWQKGIPHEAYMKSLWRHFMDVWKEHRGIKTEAGQKEALCAMLFNVMGKLFEVIRDENKDIERQRELIRGMQNAFPSNLSQMNQGTAPEFVSDAPQPQSGLLTRLFTRQ